MISDLSGAALAFVLGLGICFGNYKLSDFFLKKQPDKFSYVSLIRQAVQVVYIVALFFAAKHTPWDRTYLLIGGALGVTLPMLYFTTRLLKTNNSVKAQTGKKEGEENG
ncbi:MAG: hypothetical protein E7535_02370 [Ruminococcaceae bacterium]|nr:hypothetical protein [Oscillospiraceae bacterium]